jgi:Copper binding proteins, plastocyanin/azurin family
MRRPRTLALALCVLAASGTLAACGGDNEEAAPPAAPPAETATPPAEGGTTLQGSVGPGFEISLTQDGNPVTELPAGTYTIDVNDQADVHNFHLSGPGVDEATDVAGTGETTWTVDLQAGEYTFVCDPHASSMNGSFTVQ